MIHELILLLLVFVLVFYARTFDATRWNIFRGAIAAIGAALLARANISGVAAPSASAAAAAATAAAVTGIAEGGSSLAAGVTEKVCGAIPMVLSSSTSSSMSAVAPWFHVLVTVPAGLQVVREFNLFVLLCAHIN